VTQVFARKIIRIFGEVKDEHIQNEIRAVAKLCWKETHKNLVAVFDYGLLITSYYFLDMELCKLNLQCWIDDSCTETISQKPCYPKVDVHPNMRLREIWSIMEDVTNGLTYIHDQKEIHRDLKPRNSNTSANSALLIGL
jgi:serine/threonine protein kinase